MALHLVNDLLKETKWQMCDLLPECDLCIVYDFILKFRFFWPLLSLFQVLARLPGGEEEPAG